MEKMEKENKEETQQEFSDDELLNALQNDSDLFAEMDASTDVKEEVVVDKDEQEPDPVDNEPSDAGGEPEAGGEDDQIILSRADFDRLIKAAEEGVVDPALKEQAEQAKQADDAQAKEQAQPKPVPQETEGLVPFGIPDFKVPDLEIPDEVLEDIGIVDCAKFRNVLAKYGEVIAKTASSATLQSVMQGLPAQIMPFAARAAENFVEVNNFLKEHPELENTPRMWARAIAMERQGNPNRTTRELLDAARNRVSFATEIAQKAARSKGSKVIDARNKRGQFAPGGAGARRGQSNPKNASDGGILEEMTRESQRTSAFLEEFGITG